jgi:general secretion pathway protein L
MSEYVIVRINDKLIPEFQINYNTSDNTAKQSKVLSWESIKLQNAQKLILILSANLVLTTKVKIPSKNEEVIRQSIPFALEEELATDVDDNHFSYSPLADQSFLVSIINKSIIKKIQTHLLRVSLNCKEIYSEIFTVPHQQDKLVLCDTEEGYIVRDGLLGITLDDSMLITFLAHSKNKEITFYTNNSNNLSVDNKVETKKIDTVHLQAKTLCLKHGVNLFQGEFTQNIDSKKSLNPWKKLITLSALLIFSWLAIHLYEIYNLSTKIEDIKSQQMSLLIQSIPNANETELKDPYSAFMSRIKQSQNSQLSSNNQGFIVALSYLGKTLSQIPNIQVQSLRLRDQKLEVRLLAPNVNTLNQFQLNLKNIALSMRINTGTRNSDQNGVSSIISMEQL